MHPTSARVFGRIRFAQRFRERLPHPTRLARLAPFYPLAFRSFRDGRRWSGASTSVGLVKDLHSLSNKQFVFLSIA